MLGLKRHTVRLVDHDPKWADEFRRVSLEIVATTGIDSERIQHVRSTAVLGLRAKPILDVDLGLADSDDIEDVVRQLVRQGYLDRGDGAPGIGRLLVWESAPAVRTVHLHLHPAASNWWHGDVAFRDALRRDDALRTRYARLKADLAERFPNDRSAYREGKAAFFRDLPWDIM